jgi:hypothetical protein
VLVPQPPRADRDAGLLPLSRGFGWLKASAVLGLECCFSLQPEMDGIFRAARCSASLTAGAGGADDRSTADDGLGGVVAGGAARRVRLRSARVAVRPYSLAFAAVAARCSNAPRERRQAAVYAGGRRAAARRVRQRHPFKTPGLCLPLSCPPSVLSLSARGAAAHANSVNAAEDQLSGIAQTGSP